MLSGFPVFSELSLKHLPASVFFHEILEKGVDFPEKGGIIFSVPYGGLAQLVRAHASHA